MSEWTRIPARELLRIQTTSKKIESVPVHKLDRPIAVTHGVTRATAYNKCSYDCTNSLYNFVIIPIAIWVLLFAGGLVPWWSKYKKAFAYQWGIFFGITIGLAVTFEFVQNGI